MPGTWTARVLLGCLLAAPACSAHRLNQIYYLGVFDPQDQLPPSLYRIRVKGSSEWFSNVNYAAGWVPSQFIDSLGSRVEFDRENGSVEFSGADADETRFALQTGRRLMLFGPEGFREAPKDHRLVILMDSDPSQFFEAIESALGQVSAAKTLTEAGEAAQRAKVQEHLLELLEEHRDLRDADALRPDALGEGV